jgi:hypothetical protein
LGAKRSHQRPAPTPLGGAVFIPGAPQDGWLVLEVDDA